MSQVEAFEQYDQELRALIQTLHVTNDDSQMLVQQCEDLLRLMALEARSITEDPSLKHDLLTMVKTRKLQFEPLRLQVERQIILVSSPEEDTTRASTILRANEDRISQQNETLERARRTMAETESIGMEVSEELARNRETLEASHGKVKDVASMSERASKILDSMNRRWFK